MQAIDNAAKCVIARLEAQNFRAYLVGGCVRDLLLGRQVHDWDIATSATPAEVQAAFPKTVPTGLQHGTVTVLMDGKSFEVTTFRRDGDYTDGRRPDSVNFVTELSHDLSRRDFTINAMAMDAEGIVTDLFSGREDLKEGVIRCVGEPERRFREDALRMLRAVRFSAQLGFAIEEKTLSAICSCAALSEKLSAERVRDEVEKTILSERPEKLGQMIELGLLRPFGLCEAGELTELNAVRAERYARWAQAKHMLPTLSLSAFRLEKRLVRLCEKAVQVCEDMGSRIDCKRVIAVEGADCARLAAQLCGREELVEEILLSGECVSLLQLAIRGGDLPHLQGRAVAEALQKALLHVLEHPEDNERRKLLSLLVPELPQNGE